MRVARSGRDPCGARSWTSSRRARAQRLGPSELARRLGLPKSSIANICNALADIGLVRRIGTGFALGPEAGRARRRVPRVRRPGAGVLRGLPQLPTGSEETVQLAVLDGLEMTYLARHDGRQPVRLTSQIGRRLPGDGRPRPARPRSRPSTTASSSAGSPASTSCRSLTPNSLATVDALLG